jgi:Holliday junction resolvase RusA-like endonuclease
VNDQKPPSLIFIPGEPIPQPRHKFRIMGKGAAAIPVPYIPTKHPVHAWKQAVALLYRSGSSTPLIEEGPIQVALEFVLPRPESRTTKRGDNVREWHDRRPDCDNLAKAALDALKGVAWHDDSQIARLAVAKVMASATEDPGMWITVERVGVSPTTGHAITTRMVTPGLFD